MEYFPLFVDLRDQQILVIGGGAAAKAKIQALAPIHPRILVLSRKVHPDIEKSNAEIIQGWNDRDFSALASSDFPKELDQQKTLQLKQWIQSSRLVICAAGSKQLSTNIASICKDTGTLMNAVDDPRQCSVIFPSIFHEEDLCVAISTGGASPTAAKWLKGQIQQILPDHFAQNLMLLKACRPVVFKTIESEALRKVIFEDSFSLLVNPPYLLNLDTMQELFRKWEHSAVWKEADFDQQKRKRILQDLFAGLKHVLYQHNSCQQEPHQDQLNPFPGPKSVLNQKTFPCKERTQLLQNHPLSSQQERHPHLLNQPRSSQQEHALSSIKEEPQPSKNPCSQPDPQPGFVWIAGAGCADQSGLSLKVFELLKICDVLVYDDLIGRDILDLFEGEEKIYVGKRKNAHSWKQEDINDLLVRLAKEGKSVLRLKGGDPFVFGRGMEEVLALRKNKIDYQVVPGLSSALAVPLRMEIPLTHRGISTGFMVMTCSRANTPLAKEGWEKDVQSMADFDGTIVLLMGAEKIDVISKDLIQAGKDPRTPAALICSPDIVSSRMIASTLQDLPKAASEASLPRPGIVVIGPVVELAKENQEVKLAKENQEVRKERQTGFKSTDLSQPGKARGMEKSEVHPHSAKSAHQICRVGMVGTRRFYNRLNGLLERSSSHVSSHTLSPLPSMELIQLIEGIHSDFFNKDKKPEFLEELFSMENNQKNAAPVLVFTSPYGVECFLKCLKENEIDFRSLYGMEIACVGPATASVWIEHSIYPSLVPDSYTTEDLGKAMIKSFSPEHPVWLYRSKNADLKLNAMLEQAGFTIRCTDLYSTHYLPAGITKPLTLVQPVSDTSTPSFSDEVKRWKREAEECSIIVLGSAFAAQAWIEVCQKMKVDVHNFQYAVLSAHTAKVLKDGEIDQIWIAKNGDAQSLAECILERIEQGIS